jgi:hypothetical protein
MGLMKKIFGGDTGPAPGGTKSQCKVGETAVEQAKSRERRRELVQVVLRDTMRKHGIPSDWIDCRTLSAMTRQHKSGVHAQFLVRKGDDQLLNYVHAFQESFWQEIGKFDPQADQWLFSVAWQFHGKATRGFSPMPDPGAWSDEGATRPPDAGDTQPPEHDTEELASDLQALYAAMSQPAELKDLPPAVPLGHRRPGAS